MLDDSEVNVKYVKMDLILLLILFASCLILYLSLKTFLGSRNFPPGPRPLPILGNVLEIGGGGDIVNSLIKLREKYGDVFTIFLGSRKVVVVNGYKLVKEVYLDNGDNYLNRGDMPAWEPFYKNYGLIYTTNFEAWKELRRFSVSALRDFGFGKRSTEDRIQEESQCLVAELKKTEQSFCDPRHYVSRAMCNVIFSIMFGNRHDYGDKDIDIMLNYMYDTFVIVSSAWGQVYEMFPWLMKFIPGPHQKINQLLQKLSNYVDSRVQMHLKTLDPNNPRDYIDAFLIKIDKEKMNPSSYMNMKQLLACTTQIFFAGVETSSTTLTYALLVLLKYPDVLAKVHEEIDHVIGQNRGPTMQDRNNMPYTDATICEMQRFTNLIPMGVPRKTIKQVTLNGYTLPKDTDVLPMLTSVLKDPAHFKYPTEFNPENFLNEKGEFHKNNAFMPLAAGKRICMGEPLVRMELFLFLVAILQNFNLKSPVPQEELDITPIVSGLGNFPKAYKIAFIPR